ncbi:MAG TPA: TonB-dependent receptor [Candidatus Limnocylindrales bacterium]|nr:TonB-dependent receptor [Candidatus Limnocylindrales bacterium]
MSKNKTGIGALAALALALPLGAQIDNGNITGRVTDPSGGAIVGAQVTVTQTQMNFETVAATNEEGIYRALNLRPGRYRLTFVAPGFKKMIRDNLELHGEQTLAQDAAMEVGQATESIQVSGKPQLLDTETSTSGTTVDGNYFFNLPNYQRHTVAVLLFTPGVTFDSNHYTKSLSGLTIDGLGGSNAAGVGYFEDGAVATMGARGDNAETVTNAVEDIKVFTSAAPAEYGHSAGVGISVVKKSGSNDFHGLLQEEIRTRSMQQRRFFEQYRNSQIQPGFSINPPGLIVQNPDANLSGPVYIPKIYNGKNKTFFFYGLQMMIEKQGKQLTATVPTPAELNGDFSFTGSGVTPNTIYDPDTTRLVNGQWFRDPFPGNIIPRSRWSTVATKFLALNPIGAPDVAGNWTTTGPVNNVQMGPMKITKWQNHTARLDHQISTALKLFTSYTYNHEWGRQPTLSITNPLFDSSLNLGITDRHTASLGATWVPSPTMVNDLRVSYYGRITPTESIALNNDYASLLGMGNLGLPPTCLPGVIPSLITDQASLSPGCGNRTVQETYTVKDDVSKAMGAHNFKMGYELLRYHQNANNGPGNVDGSFTYSGVNGITTTGNSIANTGGIPLAQFMTGDISSFSFGSNTDNLYTRSWQHSVYFQDDWKVSPNLTVNFGVRYNVEPPKTYKGGYISLFDLSLPDNSTYTNTAYQAFCPPGGCKGAYTHPKNATPFDTDWGRIDPVAGLAWHFMPKMVLRAGARIAHLDTYTDNTSLLFTNELLSRAYSASQISGNFMPLFNLNNGIPAWSYPALRPDGSTPTIATNAGAVSPTITPRNIKTPYVATWNIGLQREAGKDYVVELRWEGSAESKGYATTDINTRPWGIIPSPNHDGTMMNLNDPANALFRYQWATGTMASYQTQYARPYPNLGSVSVVCNCYHMEHNAGIVRLEKRYSRGLNFQVYYTYSKTLGMSSTSNLNPYLDWHLLKARTAQDQTHNLTGTMNYELPVGRNRHFLSGANRLVDALFGGYNIAWTYTIASGLPTGMSISGVSLPSYTAGGQTFTNINVPQYPSFMPNFGNVLLLQRPSLRDNWQDLGGDRFNQGNQNSMIDCGPVVLNHGNSCFTYVPAFSLGNNGANVWNNQRLIAASGSIGKEVPLRERMRLQLRLDWQNPFKWYNWGGPSTALNVQSAANSLLFGKINPGSNGETATGTSGYGGTPLLNLNVGLKW